jgi:uncharacterized RDD family membrane protein YckC
MIRASTLTIRTPEGVEFALPLAGPFARMAAAVLDLLVVIAAATILQQALGPLNLIGPDAVQAVFTVAYFALNILYTMVSEWFWRGQTIGKRLFGLRVVEASGLRLHPSQIVVRNVMRLFDMFPAFYFVGGISCVLSRKRQRLGDIVAGTVVIRSPKLTQLDLSQLQTSRHNSLAAERHLAARLRQKSAPEAAGLALEALLRRDNLEPASRLALFRELAGYFRGLVSYPPETVEQLSDEQYVRDVVEILYAGSSS